MAACGALRQNQLALPTSPRPRLPSVSFVFVSHAAPDKLTRVKPLVHALALEGVTFWLDRPGAGEHDFHFPEAFIRKHGLRSLRNGLPWDEAIRAALIESSAVLVCLSKQAIEPARIVLRQEIFAAHLSRKAVTCVVDDLDMATVPDDAGLMVLSRSQSDRVDIAGISAALAWLEAHPGVEPDALPMAWRAAWQTVRKLRDDLDAAARGALRAGVPPAAPSARLAALLGLLAERTAGAAQLQRLYRRSLADSAREQHTASVAGLLADLEDSRPRSLALPSPLIEFAERLGRERQDAALLQWVDAQTADNPAARTALRQQLDAEDQQAAALATLFVDVDTEGEHQVRWWVHAPDPSCCLREEFVALNGGGEDALAACLTHALARADALVGHRFRLRVALLLPLELLARGIEALPITFDDGDDLGTCQEPLCRRHPITLHWRTRALARTPGRAVNAWNRALSALDGRLRSGGGANVLWSEPGGAALPAAAARLLDPAETGICLGLGMLPVAHAEIAACLREGVPCFFWFRAPAADAAALRFAVCDEFSRHRPSDAPTRVGQLRMISPVGGPFAALSVVWDEPGHLPSPELFACPPETPPP